MTEKKVIKAKNMMYVQQMSYLPTKTIEKLIETIKAKLDELIRVIDTEDPAEP